ncbi:MAG: hypothetical protein ACOVP4_13835 [Bacteriovoracaceae bacterium]
MSTMSLAIKPNNFFASQKGSKLFGEALFGTDLRRHFFTAEANAETIDIGLLPYCGFIDSSNVSVVLESSLEDIESSASVSESNLDFISDASFEDFIYVLDECSHEGWDGHFAEPVRIQSAVNTINFLNVVPQLESLATFFAHPDGRFGVRFKNKENSISICFDDNNNVTYAGLLGDEEALGSFKFNNILPKSLSRLLENFI